MKRAGQILFKILFWNYPRGSWQYDLFCIVLILLTLFIKPGFLVTPKKNHVPIRILLSHQKAPSPTK